MRLWENPEGNLTDALAILPLVLFVFSMQHCCLRYSELSRVERGHLCACGWEHLEVCVCVRLIIHVWLNTAGHQQLRQASAVEKDESCHRQVTLDPSQNDLLPSFFLPSSSFTISNQSHMEVQLAAGFDCPPPKKKKILECVDPRLLSSQRIWQHRNIL